MGADLVITLRTRHFSCVHAVTVDLCFQHLRNGRGSKLPYRHRQGDLLGRHADILLRFGWRHAREHSHVFFCHCSQLGRAVKGVFLDAGSDVLLLFLIRDLVLDPFKFL